MNTLPPKAPPKPKIPLVKVHIHVAEGPMAGKEFTVPNFKEGNAILHQVSNSAPTSGGYHKVDFVVTYQDGNEYAGRYDVTHLSRRESPLSLADQMRNHLTFHAGLRCPAHMDQAKYEKTLAEYGHEALAKATKFLTTYSLEDPATPPPVDVIDYSKPLAMLVDSVGGVVKSYEDNAAELTTIGRTEDAHKQTRRAFELRKALTYILKAREIT